MSSPKDDNFTIDKSAIQIPKIILVQWQGVVDTMARLIGSTAGVVTRIFPPQIEVVSSSSNPDNPYPAGARVDWADHYCEYVIRTDAQLLVPDARLDPDWNTNPDLPIGLVSYLGLPIHWPDGQPFGTLCVLDKKGREYSDLEIDLMVRFQGNVEAHLELIIQKIALEAEAAERELLIGRLREALIEIQTLNELVPVCVKCKTVRNDSGFWQNVEDYVESRFDPAMGVGLCPDCARQLTSGENSKK